MSRGYIEIATEPAFAPNEFIDPSKTGDDQYVGSDIELANYIADSLGVELRLKPMDFTSVLGSMTSGKYDLAISALAYTPARAETMNLSKGYYFGSEDPQKAYGILIRKEDADKIKTIDDLADKTVVAQNGSIQEMFVREQIPAYGKYNQVSSTNDAFLMVQTGRADAMAAALKMAQLYLDSNPECGLMILPDFYFTVDESTQGTRIGIPKGEDELTDRINGTKNTKNMRKSLVSNNTCSSQRAAGWQPPFHCKDTFYTSQSESRKPSPYTSFASDTITNASGSML